MKNASNLLPEDLSSWGVAKMNSSGDILREEFEFVSLIYSVPWERENL